MSFLKLSQAVAVVCILACALSFAARKPSVARDISATGQGDPVITASTLRGPFNISQAAAGGAATWLTAGDSGGLALNTGVDRKAGGYPLAAPAAVGTLAPSPGNPNPFVAGMGDGNNAMVYWNDGVPDQNNGAYAWEWSIAGINNGFSVTFPGTATNATTNTATVFAAAYCAQLRMTVKTSDDSFAGEADPFLFSDAVAATGTDYVYNVQYRTNSPAAKVTLSFVDINASQCKGQRGTIAFRGELLRIGSAAAMPVSASAVAAAPRQLTAISIAKPAPAADSTPTETPGQADAFVDSVGVMTFFGEAYRPPLIYYTNLSTAQHLLITSGIRHIRDHVPPVGYPGHDVVQTDLRPLEAAGVRMDFQTALAFTKTQILAAPIETNGMIDLFEAPNEPDDQGNPDWVNQVAGYQVDLAAWVKNNPPTARIGIIGPSIVHPTAKYPNQACCMDYGNSHGYQSSYNPENPGYGSQTPFGNYGSTDYNVNFSALYSVPKPVVFTECGYGSMPTGQSYSANVIDYHAGLRYTPRLYFWHFAKGVPRTYQGELIDDRPLTSTAGFAQYGLVDQSMHVKPAYTAVSDIISILSDKGKPFATEPLSYTLRGATNDVQHVLLEKRDGSYWLAIWLGVRSWDVACGKAGHPACSQGDIFVKPQDVTVTTTRKYASVRVYTSNELGRYTSAPVRGWTGTSGSISVTDKVSIVRLVR